MGHLPKELLRSWTVVVTASIFWDRSIQNVYPLSYWIDMPNGLYGLRRGRGRSRPSLFYNPYPSYPYYYPTSYYPYPSYPYYYPTSHYTYPTRFVKNSAAAATPEAPKKETVEAIPEAPAAVATPNALPSVPLIRRIVPFLDVLRTGDGVAWKRPDEVDDVTEPEPNQNKISWYNTVPYTQAYLNRIPASSYYY